MVYQGKGALERSTKKRRHQQRFASRLRPHLCAGANRPKAIAELRYAGMLGRRAKSDSSLTACMMGPAARRQIRSAWEGILEDAGLGDDRRPPFQLS